MKINTIFKQLVAAILAIMILFALCSCAGKKKEPSVKNETSQEQISTDPDKSEKESDKKTRKDKKEEKKQKKQEEKEKEELEKQIKNQTRKEKKQAKEDKKQAGADKKLAKEKKKNDNALPEPEHNPDDRTVSPPKQKKDTYPGPDVKLVEYNGTIEHLFFHPIIAYPELAFDGDYMEKGIDDWMLTVDEYKKILNKLYENNYIIVDIREVWSEDTSGDGQAHMKENTLMLPEGKKPLILSYDDVNYYEYMLENGFTYKLIVGDDGKVWSYGLDPKGNEVISQDLDAITILDSFVDEHPDFSMHGIKGCIALTGYEGILGYRTQTDTHGITDEQEKTRQNEIKAVKPVVEALKDNGWYFGCHTWGHVDLSTRTLQGMKEDQKRWDDEVGSLVGDTTLMFYPHGARPDGDDVSQTGEVFRYLQEHGFRVFFSVGIESYSKVKDDISAVIADRLHPDGTTLRWSKDRYKQFYDPKDIFDFKWRPDFGYDF